MTKYEYEYYSGSEICPNTNIMCDFIMTKKEYEYYLGSEIFQNTNIICVFIMIL